jgi:predicted permease
MAHLAADLRYAWRSLRQAPVFTAVAVLSIALGIGANAAIFTLVDQVLLRLLPVTDPARMVLLKGPTGDQHYGSNYGDDTLSYPMYEDIRDHNDVFDGMFCRYPLAVQIGFNGSTERANGELVSGSYFPVLGVGAAAGRVFGPEDDRVAGGHPLAVLSYGYWTSRFLRDPSIIGKALLINNQMLTVIGVAQEGFAGLDVGETTQVFVPVMMKAQMTPVYLRDSIGSRRSRWVNVFGRLKSNVTAEQAQAHLRPFFHTLLEMEVKEPAFARASAYTKTRFLQGQLSVLSGAQGKSRLRGGLRKPLWVLMGLVGGVLLIACANVAGLLVARAAARQREVAIRLALGASRARIVQQMLVESLLIAFAGSAAGLALAMGATGPLLTLLVPAEQQVAVTAAMDFRLLAFAFGATLLTGVLFGLVPALQAARPRLATTLKDQAGSVAGGGALRLRKALVVAQVALSLLLLIGAGLFIRSVQRLMTVDLGFRAAQLVSFSVDPTLNGYSRAHRRELHHALLDRLQATPGVDSVALSAIGPLGAGGWDNWITVEGYKTAESETIDPYFNAVSPGYFPTLGIPLIAGRDFEARDLPPVNPRPGEPAERVAIVSETFAKKYLGGTAHAIGRHIGLGKDPGTPTPIEIIGVSKDARIIKVREEPPLLVFLPSGDAAGTILIRTRLDPAQILPTLRGVVHAIDPNLPIFATRTMEGMIQQSTRNERLMANLSAVFGTLATLLATVGLYGVLAYTVTRRTREIGIRMALGALRSHVSWLVLREVVLLAAAGMAIALPTAWWLGRFVESQLYDVAAMDPAAIMAAMTGLAAVALLAGLVPTLRATRINPVRALRQD